MSLMNAERQGEGRAAVPGPRPCGFLTRTTPRSRLPAGGSGGLPGGAARADQGTAARGARAHPGREG